MEEIDALDSGVFQQTLSGRGLSGNICFQAKGTPIAY